jgi:catechol 2,3-dioxygenase-like lactoylglutathione lyase family enzyme
MVALGPPGLTIQLWVGDGSAGRGWYARLFGRPPDFTPFSHDTFCEWIFKPGYWEIHVVEKDHPEPRQAPVRFGVEDIHAARQQVLELGVGADAIEELPGVVRWCNFTDPWGNRLGFYQDLSRWP